MSASASPDRGTTDARSRPWFAAQSADTLPPSADTLAPVRSSCGNTARAHVVPEVISRLRLYAPVPVPLPQRPGLGGSLTKASRTSCRGCRNRPRSFNRTMRLYLPMRDVMRTTAQPMKATTSAKMSTETMSVIEGKVLALVTNRNYFQLDTRRRLRRFFASSEGCWSLNKR
jgi:hypothetical protein